MKKKEKKNNGLMHTPHCRELKEGKRKVLFILFQPLLTENPKEED